MKNVSIIALLSSALLAGCGQDENTAQTQPNDMIESPIQSTVIECFDQYPPEPVAPKVAARSEGLRASPAEPDVTGTIRGHQP